MTTPATLEREVKLQFGSVEEARDAVTSAGAAPLRCRRLQEDALLDDKAETLRKRCCALRVRVESGRSLVTFKGPVQVSPMKLREEIETVIGDGETMLRCFEQLGYDFGRLKLPDLAQQGGDFFVLEGEQPVAGQQHQRPSADRN